MDRAKGAGYWHQAAKLGLTSAQAGYAGHLFNTSQDPALLAIAFDFSLRAAEPDNLNATHQVGFAYSLGRGVAENSAEAVLWYQRSATAGLAQAQYALYLCYASGLGVAADPAMANHWLCKAAEGGFTAAIEDWQKTEGLSRN